MFFISVRSSKPKPPQIAHFLLVKNWNVISLHVECIASSHVSVPMEQTAQERHYPMPISLHFHCLDYHCTTISGPCGPSLWSPFKSSPYSSVLGSETKDGCSRSLLSVFCSKKKVSLLFCKPRALVCMLALVSVQSLQSMSEAHSVLRPLSWWMAYL